MGGAAGDGAAVSATATNCAAGGAAAGGAAAGFGEPVELPASLTAVWEAARKVTRWVREQLRQARR